MLQKDDSCALSAGTLFDLTYVGFVIFPFAHPPQDPLKYGSILVPYSTSGKIRKLEGLKDFATDHSGDPSSPSGTSMRGRFSRHHDRQLPHRRLGKYHL